MKLSELFAEDTRTSITKDKEDYEAKRKALQDIQLDPETNKSEKLKKELMRRKYELEKEAGEKGFKESATAGATSSGNIASVEAPHLSPGKARGKKSDTGAPWGGRSGTKAPPQPKVKQPKAGNGTAKNALDMKNSIFGENPVRR